MFLDRIDAAQQLADVLTRYKGSRAVLLAIPRGGVPVAVTLGRLLDLPVDFLLTKKIGHPANRELAIGAVCATDTILDPRYPVTPFYVRQEEERLRTVLKMREDAYRAGRAPIPLAGRPVILVDDGIATGFTMRAAIELARKAKASDVIVATPVAARETSDLLRALADEVICLQEPIILHAIGAHYQDFGQVSDEEVLEWLADAPTDQD